MQYVYKNIGMAENEVGSDLGYKWGCKSVRQSVPEVADDEIFLTLGESRDTMVIIGVIQ